MEYRISDFAEEILALNGVKFRSRNAGRVIEEAMGLRSRKFHSTSDFAAVLADSTNKLLRAEYEAVDPTFKLLATRRDLTDFKPASTVALGDFPQLLQVGETGEIKSGTISNGKESIQLATFARKLSLSRQVLVNDDLGAFADLTTKMGRRCVDFQNGLFFTQLQLNSGVGPTMNDGNPLFHTSHANLSGTSDAISVTSLSKARAALRKQTGLDGIKINVAPRYLVVGPDKETEASTMIAPVIPSAPANVNPFSGKLEVVSDANITGNGWYLFADPASAAAWTYGYLAGDEGPRIKTRDGFDVEGIDFSVALDFAVAPTDFRPIYRNPGA